MTIEQIYKLFIKLGISADPRGKAGVARTLGRVAKHHKRLSKSDQEYFDRESLTNPYSDTRILFGKPSTVVDKVLVGIDIHSAEMLLADRLNEKGASIDLVIAHHPEGRALAALDEVMDLQVDLLHGYGVPINVAESLMKERVGEVFRRFAPLNHHQAIDAGRLLNMPFMCVHTPADNLGWKYLTERIEDREFDTVDEVVDTLMKIEEFKIAQKQKAGPMIFLGSPHARAGKVRVVEFTGGTEGAKEVYERLSHAGIGTIIGMHISEEHRKEAQKHHMNLVVTGHMASDSIGMNLLSDELESKGVKVLPCSGFIRVKRNK
jgi:putative NIF3 family GTP cyclohydrolase 1 type 2